ncbi:MAG TPA: glycosyltransferase family 9 protein [Bacteroidales bacterium]|nr:glycosyltransferase family 9 protein [Bacteroidales bacterium]
MKRFLIIQTASIGDVILATPVAEKLHRFYPDADIDLLVKKGMESLFAGHPFLGEILTWDKSRKKYRHLSAVIWKIRRKKYDTVINIQRFTSTGLITALSGAATRIGFSKNPFRFFFTERIAHEIAEGVHECDRNLRLIGKITDTSKARPALYPTPADAEAVAAYKRGKYYTISPASLWFTKQFPPERWAELIRAIDGTAKIYLLGSSNDQKICEEVIKAAGHPGAVSLAGKLTFLQSASLMKDAAMNFTNDSAPLHLASAVNAPVTAVYCSTLPSFGFGPLSDDSAVVEIPEKLYCRPCGLHGLPACPEKHFRCAKEIRIENLTERL